MPNNSSPSEPNRATRRANKGKVHAQRKAGKAAEAPVATHSTPPKEVVEDADDTATTTAELPDETVPTTRLEASFKRFEPEARALAKAEVKSTNANVMVLFQNARRGVLAVQSQREALERDPDAPRVDWPRVEATVAVAEALLHANRAAYMAVESRRDFSQKLSAMFAARDILLSNAVAAVKAGVLVGKKADVVARIQKGSGPIDNAQDCVDLVALFRSSPELRGRVTVAQVADAEARGIEMLHMLAPEGVEVPDGRPSDVAMVSDLRDRIGVVLERYYAYVARVGGWCWGLEVGEHVPALRARSVARKGAKPSPEPTPEPTPDHGDPA